MLCSGEADGRTKCLDRLYAVGEVGGNGLWRIKKMHSHDEACPAECTAGKKRKRKDRDSPYYWQASMPGTDPPRTKRLQAASLSLMQC